MITFENMLQVKPLMMLLLPRNRTTTQGSDVFTTGINQIIALLRSFGRKFIHSESKALGEEWPCGMTGCRWLLWLPICHMKSRRSVGQSTGQPWNQIASKSLLVGTTTRETSKNDEKRKRTKQGFRHIQQTCENWKEFEITQLKTSIHVSCNFSSAFFTCC